jgi:FixJ family two-component response regulator
MLIRIIRSAGLDVEAFASAEELLESGHIHDSSCLVLDLRLPGIDGFDLQGHLTSSGCGIPIIFVTTEMDEGVRERALRAGAAGFFNKPFRSDSFLQAVQRAGRCDGIGEHGNSRWKPTTSSDTGADAPAGPLRLTESSPTEESPQ